MVRFNLMALVVVGVLLGCDDNNDGTSPTPPGPVATVFNATGDITAKVNEFRNLLGASNGGTAGEQPGGRREISWDGAGANPFNNKDNFPADFFSASGAVFTTPGTGFRNDSLEFAEVNPGYASQFNFFSATKIFSPVGSNQMDILLRVAGQPSPALTQAFGIVFSDVDVAGKTTIELFAQDGTSLGKYEAPVRSDAAGLSFVGVALDQAVIARVRVILGTGALGAAVNDISAGGTLDLVVMDNFIYGEPRRAL